jgi:hypothetical protein
MNGASQSVGRVVVQSKGIAAALDARPTAPRQSQRILKRRALRPSHRADILHRDSPE